MTNGSQSDAIRLRPKHVFVGKPEVRTPGVVFSSSWSLTYKWVFGQTLDYPLFVVG